MCWKNEEQPGFFKDFEIFEYLMKHCFECLIYLSKLIIKYRENERIKSPKSMPIKIGFSNHPHAYDMIFFVETIYLKRYMAKTK